MVGYGMPTPKMGRPKEEEAGALFNRWDPSPECTAFHVASP
jgi:hypothetical protein